MELRLCLLPILVMELLHSAVAREMLSADTVTVTDLCENAYKTVNNIECYCKNTLIGTKPFVFKAECSIDNENIPEDDEIWKAFTSINTIESITIDPKKNKMLTYVPTQAFKVLRYLLKVTIQHGNVNTLHAFAFANLTSIQEIKLSKNGIKDIAVNAFAHHPNLISLTMDNNNIEEIKRNAFRRLPQLEHLYLTNNNISTIHDRAFSHLGGLKSLELDKNSIFVLTNETFSGLGNLTTLQLSYNNIEIIGKNTFYMLENLHTLHLDNNKIRLLNDGALRGLKKLESLLLSNNRIKQLTSPTLFFDLPSLVVLEVRSNGMQEFALDTIGPILTNFYKDGSNIDVDDNKFPCDCNLNWFLNIRNNTKNRHLQEKIDNLMCYPSEYLSQEFQKYEESEKSKSIDDKKQSDVDYEYYDEKSLDGKLFFSDIPHHLLPCDRPAATFEPSSPQPPATTTNTKKPTNPTESTTSTIRTEVNIQTTMVTGPPTSTTTRKPETPAKPDTIAKAPFTVTTPFTEMPVVLKSRTIELPRYTPSMYSHRTTHLPLYTQPETKETVTDYNPPKSTVNEITRRTEYRPPHQTRHNHSLKNVMPTEDMVSDGNGDSTLSKAGTKADLVDKRHETKVIDEENNTSTKENKVQPTVYKSTIDQQTPSNAGTVSYERKSPETMSHVHQASSANKVLIYIPIWLFTCLRLIL